MLKISLASHQKLKQWAAFVDKCKPKTLHLITRTNDITFYDDDYGDIFNIKLLPT